MDPDSLDTSYPNVAPMHDILQDALDDLVSNRTSTAIKGEALLVVEHVLAQTSDPRAVGLPRYFNALQDTFQCNVSSRIIAWTSVTSSLLDKCLDKGCTDVERQYEAATLSGQLVRAMAILQGVALVHKQSKQFLGRRYPLEVLLDLFLVSRHLNSSSTPSPSTPTSPKSGTFSVPMCKSQDIPLASVILDTLLCIFVDSIPALRVFEDLNGVQVVVRILKRAGTPREVRMKCLEFLYFYLLDETTPPETSDDLANANFSVSNISTASSPPPSHRSQLSISATSQSGYSTSPSSRSSSSSSAFSVLSTSTTATSASLHDSQATKTATTLVDPIPAPKPIIPGLKPSARTVTPPLGGPGVLGKGQPRSLLMLKKEVDYVPLSPKKPQLSHLGRGSSGLRPKLSERGISGNSSTTRLHPSGTASGRTATEDWGRITSTGSTSRTPKTRPAARLSMHSRGLSVSSISSVSSVSSFSSVSSPSASDISTPIREGAKSKEMDAVAQTPKASSSNPKSHRRTQSLADFSSESQFQSPSHLVSPSSAAALKTGPRSASSPTAGASANSNRGPRTMEEKKEILGTMLGNVDALVEGVKKAGVWGLC